MARPVINVNIVTRLEQLDAEAKRHRDTIRSEIESVLDGGRLVEVDAVALAVSLAHLDRLEA